MSYLSERMSVLCRQRSCFDRAQTAWPSDAQRTAPTEGHTSWRVSVCVMQTWRYHVTNLETAYVTKPEAAFVWSGK